MAFRFNLFSTPQKHRVFNYQPVFYDPQKERFKEKLKKTAALRELDEIRQGAVPEQSKDYVPGSIVSGSFRDGAYRKTKSEGSILIKIFKWVMLIALAGFIYYFAKYFIIMFG